MKKLLLISALALFAGGTTMAQCPSGEVPVTVSISTDAYGTETTWTLTGPGGSPSYSSGGPYTNHGSAGAYPQTPVTVCIPLGSSVTFTITDSYGDGMCCSYGEGYYEVAMNGCTVVATGGEFNASETSTFTTALQIPLDLELVSINLMDVALAGNTNIAGQVKNNGSTDITSYDINYSVDGGALVTQSMTNTIPSCGTYNFTHNTPWDGAAGYHTVVVSVSNVNGGSADDNPANDSKSINTSMATQAVPRVSMVEEFGSSTCPPCFPFAENFTPALENFNTNTPGASVAAVEYHMNWPAPGNDRSYNPDGNTRRGFYGVSGIPSPWLDGREMNGYSTASLIADINSALAVPAFIDLDVTTTLVGNHITVNAVVTPHFDVPSGYKLHIVITEDLYTGSTTVAGYNPYDFHHTMRKMLPNGNGTTLASFVDGQPQTITQSYTLVSGNPQQGNYELWGDVSGVTVVAFVQKTATKQIFQGAVATLATDVNELDQNNDLLGVWPNPTTGMVSMRYGKATTGSAQVEVFNVLGERVMNLSRNFTST
ncbi:MAG: Omp28-related outer membrane protein, partial [Flavobacteriales bacterium]|nr:Omp28-related outer membrane protein [Flavobacteriales bacterium]